MVLGLAIKAAVLAFLIGMLSGCGMFVKEIDAWGLKMKFPEMALSL